MAELDSYEQIPIATKQNGVILKPVYYFADQQLTKLENSAIFDNLKYRLILKRKNNQEIFLLDTKCGDSFDFLVEKAKSLGNAHQFILMEVQPQLINFSGFKNNLSPFQDLMD